MSEHINDQANVNKRYNTKVTNTLQQILLINMLNVVVADPLEGNNFQIIYTFACCNQNITG